MSETTPPQNTTGTHLVAEYRACDPQRLDDRAFIDSALQEAAGAAGATVVASMVHRYAPTGISGVLVLQESHLSIHTWPSEGYAAVDLYTCGDCDPLAAHEALKVALDSTAGELLTLRRGLSGGPTELKRTKWRDG